MSITDELRECINEYSVFAQPSRLLRIADRIEAEAQDNERFRREAEPFCNRLREAAAGREDVTLFGVDYTASPVDIDGEPWHVGDKIVNTHNTHVTVSKITYKGNGRWMLHAEPNWSFYAELARHYHAPTVDGILRDFGVDIAHALDADPDATVPESIIAEYAQKLQLREE